MHDVVDRKLMHIGNVVVAMIVAMLAVIIVSVAQMATTADAAVPPPRTVRIELAPFVAPHPQMTAFRGSLR